MAALHPRDAAIPFATVAAIAVAHAIRTRRVGAAVAVAFSAVPTLAKHPSWTGSPPNRWAMSLSVRI